MTEKFPRKMALNKR